MGNPRKSKIERLPVGERRHAHSKIIVLPSESSQQPQQPHLPPHLPHHQQPSQSPLTPITPALPFHPPLPPLDDDALSKVLLLAGAPSVLSALAVCTQWRSVALDLLNRVSRVDLGKLYAVGSGRATPPTYAQVLRTLTQFPLLRVLVIQNWLYPDVMHDVADHVCSNYASTHLAEVELVGMPLSAPSLTHLLRQCPNIRRLKLGEHDDIDDALLANLGSLCRQRRQREPAYALQGVHVTRARVTREGMRALLEQVCAETVTVSKCALLREVRWTSTRATAMGRLSVTGCTNLRHVGMALRNGGEDAREVNLSQCLGLETVAIARVGGDAGKALAVRRMNLSGCRNLREMTVVARGAAEVESWALLANLEELTLFGAHALRAGVFAQTFGLSREVCALGKLRRLNVNGCGVEALVLRQYPQLKYVDCAGCADLRVLTVDNCWQMETLLAQGRRAPLGHVHLMLPTGCEVRGVRKEWHWERHASNQTISYP